MAIQKAKVSSNFTLIQNITIRDQSLTFEATGLLIFMLSLPEDWVIHKSWLQDQKLKCGRDKLNRLMKELIDAGYVVKKVKQKEDGKLDGVDWLVYPEKQEIDRVTENPYDGKTTTTNKDIYKEKKDPKPKHFSDEKRTVFPDQLDEKVFPHCTEAMSLIDYWKRKGNENLYDGPMTLAKWRECEDKLSEVSVGVNDTCNVIASIYRKYRCSERDSVSLAYLCFEGKSLDDFQKIVEGC